MQDDHQLAAVNPALPLQEQQEHYVGEMNGIHIYKCNAKYFQQEQTTTTKFTRCCQDGKVSLPAITPPSQQIIDVFSGRSNNSANFKKHIRSYNSALAMASLNASLVAHEGIGPQVVTIHGPVYHLTSGAVGEHRDTPQYAQLYIMDTNQALAGRISNQNNQQLSPEVLRVLLNELNSLNRYAQSYKHMGDVLQEEQQGSVAAAADMPPVKMIITSRTQQDIQYNNPTATEDAAVYFGDDEGPPVLSKKEIVIYPTHQQQTQHINAISEHADPVTYPLLFFHGEFGWSPDLHLTIRLQQLPQEQQIQNQQATPHRHREQVSIAQFYAYHVSIRGKFSAIHRGALLFQQYVVDAFTKIEGQDLEYIRFHQDQLNVETYQGLMDHVRAQAEAEHSNVGQIIILPSTCKGSQRYIHQNFQDAITLVHTRGKPDIFLTMTTNPRWREITEQLLPHQNANDRPDIVTRVFIMKFQALKDDVLLRHIFGRVIAYVYTIEF